jgi:thiamine pyrophosphokinase
LADPAVLATAVIVAADSGLDLAERLGITPTLVVGDLDSVSTGALHRARAAGIPIDEHPAAKDETDLDLAVVALVDAGVDRIVLVGGDGGRLDHLLANIAAVARDDLTVPVEAWMGAAFVAVVRDVWQAHLPVGAVVSVLPWAGPVVVSEEGVRWPLDHRHLVPGSTLGISNESLGGSVEITVHEGTALVVVPDSKDLT